MVGLGQEWKGGDVLRFAGGGHKVNLLKEAVEKYKDRENLLLMFTDRYIFTLDYYIYASLSILVWRHYH